MLSILVESVTSGIYMSLSQFKKMCQTKICETENQRLQLTCMMYKNLDMFSLCISSIGWWAWWIFACKRPDKVKHCRIIARLMIGESSLRCHTYRFGNNGTKICPHCDIYVTQSVGHLLFDCQNQNLLTERNKWDLAFHEEFPIGLMRSVEEMTSEEKTEFFLSGLKNSYTQEWKNVYVVISDFIVNMYTTHSGLLE